MIYYILIYIFIFFLKKFFYNYLNDMKKERMFHQLFKIRSPYNYLDGKLLMTLSMNDVMTIMLSATWSNSDQHLHRLPGGVRPAQAAGTASAMPGRRRARDGSGGEHHHLGLAPPARRRR